MMFLTHKSRYYNHYYILQLELLYPVNHESVGLALMKNIAKFWDVLSHNLVEIYQHFKFHNISVIFSACLC